MPIEGDTSTFTVPENWDGLPTDPLKMSYHCSGQVHMTASGIQDGERGQLPTLRDLVGPLCIGPLITKRADSYPASIRSDERGGASALRLHLDREAASRHHYLEFLVSPPGKFLIPGPLLKLKPLDAVVPPLLSHSISPSAVSVVRPPIMGSEISEWHPDKAIWIGRYNF